MIAAEDDDGDRARDYLEYDDEEYGAEFDKLELRQKNESSQQAEETDEQEVVRIKEPSFCSNKEGDSPQVKPKPNVESLSEHNQQPDEETGFDLDTCLKLNVSGSVQKYLFKTDNEDNRSLSSN